MAKPELGSKRVCVACGTRFYDLQRSPALCPKCGTEQPAEQPRLRRAAALPPEDKRPKKPAPVPGVGDADLDIEPGENEEEEDVLEDAAELEDDADALESDIEVVPDPDERER